MVGDLADRAAGRERAFLDWRMVWTTNDMPSQDGRVAIVTGANSGIGYETAKALADKGATVVMACRNSEKAEEARAKLVADVGGDADERVSVEIVDLASLASVRELADRFLADHDRLDLLINNAGVMATPPQLTDDGIEFQFACNHTGHFALTAGVMSRLLSTDGSRVVAVSSLAARGASLNDHDPTSLDGYDAFGVYGKTKLANQMFAVELNRRLAASGTDTISVVAHPGLTGTNLFSGYGGNRIVELGGRMMTTLSAQPASIGALPTLRAACDPDVEGGTYWGPALPGQLWGPPRRIRVLTKAADVKARHRLWDLSVELTGVDPLPDDT